MKSSRESSKYPGRVAIRRAVEAARAVGMHVGGIQISPLHLGGAIELIDASVIAANNPTDEFERWDAAGKL